MGASRPSLLIESTDSMTSKLSLLAAVVLIAQSFSQVVLIMRAVPSCFVKSSSV